MKTRIFTLSVIFLLISGNLQAWAETWKEYKRTHFIIYFKNVPQDFVENVEEAAERYYNRITKNLNFMRSKGWTWDERAEIYIYDNADDYYNSARQARWSHGVASPKDKVIRTFPSAHGFFDSTLPHELGHIIFREFIGYRVILPTWFEEGVAMNQERAQRFGADEKVRKAMENETFIPLGQLSRTRLTPRSDPELVDLYYAEAASIVNFIINELGKYKFVLFCRKLKDIQNFEKAFAKIYIRYKNFEKLNKAWVEFLKK